MRRKTKDSSRSRRRSEKTAASVDSPGTDVALSVAPPYARESGHLRRSADGASSPSTFHQRRHSDLSDFSDFSDFSDMSDADLPFPDDEELAAMVSNPARLEADADELATRIVEVLRSPRFSMHNSPKILQSPIISLPASVPHSPSPLRNQVQPAELFMPLTEPSQSPSTVQSPRLQRMSQVNYNSSSLYHPEPQFGTVHQYRGNQQPYTDHQQHHFQPQDAASSSTFSAAEMFAPIDYDQMQQLQQLQEGIGNLEASHLFEPLMAGLPELPGEMHGNPAQFESGYPLLTDDSMFGDDQQHI